MGTNYYAHLDVCSHCDRPSEVIHIGKNSGGWKFHFNGNDSIRSWEDWKVELQRSSTKILDEYGRVVPFAEFEKLVNSQKDTGQNHYDYCEVHHPEILHNLWLDPDGFCFSDTEFS